jgi:hypothetical protein
LFYEERVESFTDLGRKLRALDQDAGVRLIGGTGRRKILAFVTRFGPTYTMMAYSVVRGGTPGRRLQTVEFQNSRDLEMALRKFVKGRLQAWVY